MEKAVVHDLDLNNNEETSQLIGRRLREARLSLGLSQAKIGKVLSVSQTAIYSYETGNRTITPPDLLKLSKFFSRPVEWFFGIDEKPVVKLEIAGEVKDLQDLLAQVPADELVSALAKHLGIPEKAAWGMYQALKAAKEPEK